MDGLTQPNIRDTHVSIYNPALIQVEVKQMVISQQPTSLLGGLSSRRVIYRKIKYQEAAKAESDWAA